MEQVNNKNWPTSEVIDQSLDFTQKLGRIKSLAIVFEEKFKKKTTKIKKKFKNNIFTW